MVVRSWRSVLWGDHVIDGEGNAGTSSRRQAAIVCELRKPLVQDKYSVKAKAQQLMYGFMGYILYFDRGYNLEYNIVSYWYENIKIQESYGTLSLTRPEPDPRLRRVCSVIRLYTPVHNRVLAERLILLSLSKGSRPGGGAAKPLAP